MIPVATLVEERGARNLTDVLISRVPGLEVIPGPGVNGAGSRIRLRGVQSLVADRAPLVMVDGVRVDATEDAFSPTVPQGFPFDNPPPSTPGPLRLDDLDVEDIESVEVLGPASTAVYGPGASAGVLLIHTKRGRPGPAHWEGYAQGGVSRESTAWPANFGAFDLDNSNATFQRGLCTLGAQAVGLCVPDFMRQFNPLEQRSPFRTALRRQYGLSVSGGSGWGDYRLAGGFDGAGGAYSSRVTSPDPNYYRRLNGRASGHIRPWSGLELGVNAARMSSDLRLPPNVLETARLVEPSDSAGFEWGRMFRAQNTQAIERWLGVVEARWSPLSWVAVHGVAGFDAFDQRDAVFEPFVPTDAFPRGYLAEGTREMRHRTLALAGSATRKLSNAVQSTTTVGVEQLRDRLAQDWTARSDTGTGFGTAYRSAWLRQQQHSLGYYVEERLDFGQRILLTGAVRHDKFKEEQRGATYPSVNVSWAAHAADSAAVSLLRLRAAYGSAGPRPFEGAPVIFVPIGTPLPRIEPERTRSLELGADAGLFAGRLTGRVTYYDMRSRVFRLTVSQGFGGPGVDYSAVHRFMARERGLDRGYGGWPGADWTCRCVGPDALALGKSKSAHEMGCRAVLLRGMVHPGGGTGVSGGRVLGAPDSALRRRKRRRNHRARRGCAGRASVGRDAVPDPGSLALVGVDTGRRIPCGADTRLSSRASPIQLRRIRTVPVFGLPRSLRPADAAGRAGPSGRRRAHERLLRGRRLPQAA